MTDEIDRIARAYRGYEESQAADRWSLANRGNRAALRERQGATRELLEERGWIPLGARRILEVGCGTGAELARLVEFGAEPRNLVGVDLLPDRVEAAKQRFPQLDLRVANAERLEFEDESFDLALAITLFSSIGDPAMSHNVAREIERVIKPGGGLLWYDFRYDNPRNPNVHGVTEADVRRLFSGFDGQLKVVTLLPPLSRRLGPMTPVLYPALSRLPRMRTHVLGLLVKPSR